MACYIEITPGGFAYAKLRAGTALKAPNGLEVYFQPGDSEAAILETIEALDEIEDSAARGRVADVALSDYFEGVA